MRKGFERGRKRAGLNWVGFHDLRRFRATQWNRLGVDLKTIQELLGHADIRTTMRYVGFVDAALDDVRRAQALEARELDRSPGGRHRLLVERLTAVSHCKDWSRREDLNPQPTHYECVALPLSYAGSPLYFQYFSPTAISCHLCCCLFVACSGSFSICWTSRTLAIA